MDYAAQEDLSHLPKDPWLRTMHVLHVRSQPYALPCGEEFDKVLRYRMYWKRRKQRLNAVVRLVKRMADSEVSPYSFPIAP